MITPQFLLPIADELVVDLFAGGGGASTGIEQAIGRHVDIAINHDPEAVALHQANHPQTQHFVSDVYEVDPRVVTGGRRVGLLWASPDCTYHSKARGGKPHRDRNKARRRRGLANVVVKWVRLLKPTGQHPRVIQLENVEEFQDWGPLLDDGTPCPDRRGKNFAHWVAQLRNLGYQVEWRELRACDYGAPTIRKRLFVIARCDGMPIVWPEPTHGKPGTPATKQKKLKKQRTAAECIDWSIPCPSIFERSKPLADATCRRIARGIMRYVVEAAEPFIVPMTHTGGDRVHSSSEPLRTVTTAQRGEFALCVPTLAPFVATNTTGHAGARLDSPVSTVTTGGQQMLVAPTLVQTGYGERTGQAPRALDLHAPLGTVVGGQKHALVAAFLAQHNTGNDGHDARKPVSTIVSKGCTQGVVTAHITKFRTGSTGHSMDEPLHTVTASSFVKRPGGSAPLGVVTSNMVKLRGDNIGSGTDEPLHTISAGGTHHAEVRAFLIKYYGTDQDPKLTEPLHTVTTKDRFGLVTIRGEEYAIVDIGLRMLTPRELYRAQGFPDSYIIDHGGDGRPLTKTAQVRMCGNSVCPPLSCAITMANYREQAAVRKAA